MELVPKSKGTPLHEAGAWVLLRTTLLRDSISSLRLGFPLLPGIDLPTRLDDMVAKVDRVQRVEKTSPFSGLFNAVDRVRVHGFPDQAGVDYMPTGQCTIPTRVWTQCWSLSNARLAARSW